MDYEAAGLIYYVGNCVVTDVGGVLTATKENGTTETAADHPNAPQAAALFAQAIADWETDRATQIAAMDAQVESVLGASFVGTISYEAVLPPPPWGFTRGGFGVSVTIADSELQSAIDAL